MSVIINEFEVITEKPSGAEEGAARAEAPPVEASEISPIKIEDILRWEAERRERLRAY